MGCPFRFAKAAAAVAGLLALALATAASALAAGEGLPRTYQVQRIDSPVPGEGANFSQGTGGAGDLDGDGEFDLVTGQLTGSPNQDGQVFVISGETGRLIDTIVAPDPGGAGNRANFAFPWASRIGYNGDASSDLGSCPGGRSGQLCPLPVIGPPDGVPDILVGARGVDPRGVRDAGRSYVYDGATRALLKRIDQPPGEATELAIKRAGGTWFGRVVLWPAGLPACEGNFGLGNCPPSSGPGSVPKEVRNGDMDGGGRPDTVIGASNTTDNSTTAHPNSHCAKTPGAECQAAGRVYVYRGEDIVGSSPDQIYDGAGPNETIRTIRNPVAQADNPLLNTATESFGNALTPVGDVGTCRPASGDPPAVGEVCPVAARGTTPDGRPEVVAGAHRVDAPVDDPDPGLFDVGIGALIDGATGTILHIYQHPEPQQGGLFGIPFHHEPASGDLGDTGLPDVMLPAPAQNTRATAGGREYVMNGNYQASASNLNFARIDDPTPGVGENFGASSAGVGDLVAGPANPANEVLVGATGPFLGPANRDVINDVHFFNPGKERLLQTIPDPDQQGGSGFGESVVPIGDVNEDSFLDFVVGAWLFTGRTGVSEGRMYIFRSDNSPAPPPPTRPAATVTPAPSTLLAGRCTNRRVGTSRGDRIRGTSGGDEIFAFGGNDFIDGLPGQDCLDAGSGRDRLIGGDSNDTLLGKGGNDRLSGGAANDRLFGGNGNDRLTGGTGRDLLAGGRGADVLIGAGGKDRIFGETGNDRITTGRAGGNKIQGGSGRDRISAVNGRRDTLVCGRGADAVRADRVDRVSRDCERVRFGRGTRRR